MKNLFIILIFAVFFSCKKDDVTPPPVIPDYADSLVGTYMGQEIRYAGDNFTQEYNNATKLMTVTKISKNKIQLISFFQGPQPYFNLSLRSDGNIQLSPEGVTATGWNVYTVSSKELGVYVKDGAPKYYYYSGTKQ